MAQEVELLSLAANACMSRDCLHEGRDVVFYMKGKKWVRVWEGTHDEES